MITEYLTCPVYCVYWTRRLTGGGGSLSKQKTEWGRNLGIRLVLHDFFLNIDVSGPRYGPI